MAGSWKGSAFLISVELWSQLKPLLPVHKYTHRLGGGKPRKQQGMSMDDGYDYDDVRALMKWISFTDHMHSRGEEAQ